MKTYFKYGVILTCFILLFFMLRRCGNGNAGGKVTVDTLTQIDTVFKEVASDSEYIIYPYETVRWKTKEVFKTDTLEIFDYRDVDSAKILAAFFSERRYLDSVNVEYGKVYIRDTVTQNQIVGRSVSTRLNIPTITKTVTITKPPRTTLYLGTDLNGNKEALIYSVGVNAGFVFKNGKYWGLGYGLTKDGGDLYNIRFMLPIRLKKR